MTVVGMVAAMVLFLVLLGAAVRRIRGAGRGPGDDEHGPDNGEDGGGRGGGPTPWRPKPPSGDGEPPWWPEFERAFAAHVHRTRGSVVADADPVRRPLDAPGSPCSEYVIAPRGHVQAAPTGGDGEPPAEAIHLIREHVHAALGRA